MEASATPRDYHSNPEAMDVEPVSETGQNVNEHKKCESPHSSVSALLMNTFSNGMSQMLEFSCKSSFKHVKNHMAKFIVSVLK